MCGRGYVQEKLPNISQLLFNISAMAESSDLKFGTELGFVRPILQLHRETKVGVAIVWGAPRYAIVHQVYLFQNAASQQNVQKREYNRSSQALKAVMTLRQYMR